MLPDIAYCSVTEHLIVQFKTLGLTADKHGAPLGHVVASRPRRAHACICCSRGGTAMLVLFQSRALHHAVSWTERSVLCRAMTSATAQAHPGSGCLARAHGFTCAITPQVTRSKSRTPMLQGEMSQEQVLAWMKREMVAKANEIKVQCAFCIAVRHTVWCLSAQS